MLRYETNADTQSDAIMAPHTGGKGYRAVPYRTYCFYHPIRLPMMRRFILSETDAEAQESLQQLEKAQITDFESVLEAMDGPAG